MILLGIILLIGGILVIIISLSALSRPKPHRNKRSRSWDAGDSPYSGDGGGNGCGGGSGCGGGGCGGGGCGGGGS